MKKGFTLIELVLYMALIAILMPMIVLMLLQVYKNQQHVYTRTEIENTAAVVLADIEYEITHASKIISSTSTFDSDQSVLVFRNSDNQLQRYEYATDNIELSGTLYNIGRLRLFDGLDRWITSENLAITKFRVEPARNDDSDLTGLNIQIEISPLSTETTIDQANILELSTSIYVPVHIVEE